MTFEEVKNDYLKLKRECGSPVDMTGCFNEVLEDDLLVNPSKSKAKNIMIDIIRHGFQRSHQEYVWKSEEYEHVDISDSKELCKIYDKYMK